jgi:hypothetical protein
MISAHTRSQLIVLCSNCSNTELNCRNIGSLCWYGMELCICRFSQLLTLGHAVANSRVFLGVPLVQVHHGLELLFERKFINSPAMVQRSSVSPDDTYHSDPCSTVYVSGTCHVAPLGAASRHRSYSYTVQATTLRDTATPFSFRTVLGRRVPKYPPPHGPVITLNSHPSE